MTKSIETQTTATRDTHGPAARLALLLFKISLIFFLIAGLCIVARPGRSTDRRGRHPGPAPSRPSWPPTPSAEPPSPASSPTCCPTGRTSTPSAPSTTNTSTNTTDPSPLGPASGHEVAGRPRITWVRGGHAGCQHPHAPGLGG